MGTPILHVRDRDTDWINLVPIPTAAARYGTERCQIRQVGPLVELVLGVQLAQGWTPGAPIVQLPSAIVLPRTQYRPPIAYGGPGVQVVIARDVRIYAGAIAGGIYRLSDSWTV